MLGDGEPDHHGSAGGGAGAVRQAEALQDKVGVHCDL